MGIVIDIVDGDDWIGLYFNDKLVSQGHSLNVWDVLKLLQDEAIYCRDYIHADMDWMIQTGHLPNHLDDVVRQVEPDDEIT
jgi:hypothetical protein